MHDSSLMNVIFHFYLFALMLNPDKKGENMKRAFFGHIFSAVLCAFLFPIAAHAGKSSGALTLLENSDAKYAALGDAGTGAANDIAVMNFNPAGINTLTSGQASFLYQKGLTEDAYGRFIIGAPTKNGAMGLSVGYYNAGE